MARVVVDLTTTRDCRRLVDEAAGACGEGATLTVHGMHAENMTNFMAPQIAPYTTLQTTEVDEPFLVRLADVTPGDRDVVTVYDQVIIGDRTVVRSASGEGFWHVEVDRSKTGSIPTAHFAPHETACFAFPRR